MSNIFEAAVRNEATLRAALADADIAPMLMVLSQLSGDLQILDEVAPHIHGAWSFLESVPEDLKQKVRDRLAAVLKDYAATGTTAAACAVRDAEEANERRCGSNRSGGVHPAAHGRDPSG